ncbi:hypothetical protein DP939_07805 [Spongiactinospora rosea]|uniref:Uncharacterized protein n=1 Tax=Spongiactinospora rosea TaxID=2248750 RepID=A0A366M441_9ACTN|nr:hypothetical protein DP939_07805 [Spongiactinospora rosea]
MVEPVSAQLAVIGTLLAEARGPIRTSVVDIGSQWAQFAGWLNANAGRLSDANHWYGIALEWATEANDHDMIGTALNMKGHLAWMSGKTSQMISLSEAASRRGASRGVRSLARQQAARGYAITGDYEETERRLDQAEVLAWAAADHPEDEPDWIYFFDPHFLQMQRGLAYSILGRHTAAIDLLLTGLAAVPGDIRRSEWVGWYVSRLATAHAREGDPESACRVSAEAVEIARATDAGRLLADLRRLHSRLAGQWLDLPAVIELGERLR